MPFDVHITFTGICVFVPNKDKKDVKICVVMPDGRGKEVPNSDPPRVLPPLSKFYNKKKVLRRHAAFVTCRHAYQSTNDPYEELTGLWYLRRHRVWFETKGGSNPFSYAPNNIANLAEFIPGYNIDRKAVSDSGEGAVSQVLISEGRLEGPRPKQTWVIPNAVTKKDPVAKGLSHVISLTWEKVNEFYFKMKSMDNPAEKVRTWKFAPSSGSVELVIANLCDDNPMRWPSTAVNPSPDEDFEWYYELLTRQNRKKLRDYLAGSPLPVPHPFEGTGNGRGVNCIPVRTEDLSFDLDKHLIQEKESTAHEHKHGAS